MYRRRDDGQLIVSATDLVGFLACGHLTQLERAAARGLITRPHREDPEVELLRRRGFQHEERYIAERLADRQPTRLPDTDENGDELPLETRAGHTVDAMERGDEVIFQATVFDGRWRGHPDFLLRVGQPGRLGEDHHYEIADTKLAHSAKASALIQICSYVEQVERIQGRQPDHVYVVTGGAQIEEHSFRTAEMMAYYRHAKARFEEALDDELSGEPVWPISRAASYPDPVEHCAVCRWYVDYCNRQWRDDDALKLVAGISRTQRQTLTAHQITTRGELAVLEQPLGMELRRGAAESMWRMREQARLQVASDGLPIPVYELLQPERDTDGALVPDRGLAALPEPSAGDLFFDIEGDPFAFWEGLEYLFGIWDGRQQEYRDFWALNREQEKQAFEALIDLLMERWAADPNMHVYHYAPYEPTALKRLAGRHATREQELDRLLRGRRFVDLYRVVRQGVRVGSERYSIKNLEPLYGYAREIELRDANSSIVEFEKVLEIGDPDGSLKAQIRLYNRDDCISTEHLRDWLEERRADAIDRFGVQLPRPTLEVEKAKEPTAWQARLADVIARLTTDIPADQAAQTDTEKHTWLLANLLDWHRREEKASWWRFFELLTLSDDELVEEDEPIGRLRYEGVIGEKKSGQLIHRYRFDAQEHKVGNRSDLHDPRLPPFGEGYLGKGVIDKDTLTLDITRPADWPGPHPTSVVPHDRIPIESLQDGLMRFAEWVAQHGIEATDAKYLAVRDLLLRRPPRISGQQPGQPLARDDEPGSDAARRLAPALDATTLAIQGPPGSGKTYSGARMILALVREAGRRVGVTGSSHKVITNLLREVWEAASGTGPDLQILQRVSEDDEDERPWQTAKNNNRFDKLLASDEHDFRIVAGTVWLWARDQMDESVDTLFVDEAGQVALANVVAAGGAARNIVLLGDPQQLDQVLQGAHPPGAEKSALAHLLGESETVATDRGIFLERTWRMHPQITDYTSELFYEAKLAPVDGLEQQRVLGDGSLAGSGVRWVPVEHDGNTNESAEEAEKVAEIWRALVDRTWVDQDGRERRIGPDGIVIVSPFNAHRLRIQALLGPQARVGTVDKFQGQEAPVSIYTMATSRPEDAPRGLGFLFSLHRLNVATSRARALAIVVCSPALLRAVPKSPDQLRMVNGMCAFVEAARSP